MRSLAKNLLRLHWLMGNPDLDPAIMNSVKYNIHLVQTEIDGSERTTLIPKKLGRCVKHFDRRLGTLWTGMFKKKHLYGTFHR